MGSVPKFAKVAATLEGLLQQRLSAQTAEIFHGALRSAVGNGKGPRVAKLRDPYCGLFDAATAQLESFPPPLAADVAGWTLCAATHGRLIRPERPLTAAEAAAPTRQLIDVLRRMVDEKAAGQAAMCGSLRNLVLSQSYELLELLSGLWKREEWVRADVQEALGLAHQLGSSAWSKEQREAIARWLSTIRARTGAGVRP